MSTTTAFALLNRVIESLAGLFGDFLDLVLANWLPIMIVLGVTGLVLGLFTGAIFRMFRRH